MRELCGEAIDAATAGGAGYADARAVTRRAQHVATKNGEVESVSDGETEGIGVRVLEGATARLEGVWVSSARTDGVRFEPGAAGGSLTDVLVADVLGRDSDRQRGGGVFVNQPARVTLSRVTIERTRDLGLWSQAVAEPPPVLDLSDVLVRSTIGNSRGVRIPAQTLERYRIRDTVVMEERSDGILLRPPGRANPKLSWEETAREMAAQGEDWTDWESTVGDRLGEIPWERGKPARVAEHGPKYRRGSRRKR